MPPNNLYTRRQYRQIERFPTIRNELAAALWEMRRLRRRMVTDIQTYALRRVVMVQRKEIMELREELARLQWSALCAVADHEEAGPIEELALSGAPLPETFTLRVHDGFVEDGDA